MAHNLATINGKAAMAYQGETPWHKLGTRVESLTNVNEALAAGQLAGWDLKLEGMYLADGRKVEDAQHVVRGLDGRMISTVGPDYTILSNEVGFGVLDAVCSRFGVTIEACGALGKGERVWMLAKMASSIEPVPGDVVNGYFLIVLGHDGSVSYFGRLTPVRVVCQNTLDAALSNGENFFRFRHTASIGDNAKIAENLITTMTEQLHETGRTYAALANRQMSKVEIAEYIVNLFPAPKGEPSDKIIERQKTVTALVFDGKGSQEFGNVSGQTASAWAAYNAVAEYIDHVRPAEAKKSSARLSANVSAIFGQNANLKAAAMKAARALVAA